MRFERDLINTLLLDFHGTLTDGKLNIAHDGTMFESCCVRDVRAIREFIAKGWEVYIVTQSESKIITTFAKKAGCEVIIARDKSKIMEGRDFIAVGDDVSDIPMLTRAFVAYCPYSADTSVKVHNVTILTSKGGEGVVAELAKIWLA